MNGDESGCGGVVPVDVLATDTIMTDLVTGNALTTVVRDAINLPIGFIGVSVAPGL